MIQLGLLNTVGIDFKAVDWSDSKDVARIEKRLRIELKVNVDIQPADVDNLILFLRENALTISALLQDEVLYNIACATLPQSNKVHIHAFITTDNEEQLFTSIFKDNIENTIRLLFKLQNWKDLTVLYTLYPFLFNASNRERLVSLCENKIASLVVYINQEGDFKGKFPGDFALQEDFYKMLTVTGAQSFEKLVFNLLTAIINRRIHYKNDELLMYKIMFAMGSFTPTAPQNVKLFKDNTKIAKGFIAQQKEKEWIDNRPWIKNIIAIGFIFCIGYTAALLFMTQRSNFYIILGAEVLALLLDYKFKFLLRFPEKDKTVWRYVRDYANMLFLLQFIPALGAMAVQVTSVFVASVTIFFVIILSMIIKKYRDKKGLQK